MTGSPVHHLLRGPTQKVEASARGILIGEVARHWIGGSEERTGVCCRWWEFAEDGVDRGRGPIGSVFVVDVGWYL